MMYLLRHAETLWNFQLRKQGLNDSPLTANGKWQARTYGTVLSDRIPAEDIRCGRVQLYCSPLGRARTTAEYLVDALRIPSDHVFSDSRLIEFDYGDWTGMTNEEIEQEYPGALSAREVDKWNFTVPNGQSYADVEKKVGQWMDELPHGKLLIVVTHNVVSRVIRRRFLGQPWQEAGRLEHPQNLIYCLHAESVEAIDIGPPP